MYIPVYLKYPVCIEIWYLLYIVYTAGACLALGILACVYCTYLMLDILIYVYRVAYIATVLLVFGILVYVYSYYLVAYVAKVILV